MSATNQLWKNEEFVPSSEQLLERMLEWTNITRAARQVIRNKGSAGIDGMEITELSHWLQSNFASLKKTIETGTYRPSPVRVCKIEKIGGGQRQLGIPTVIDRMLQQALHQILNPYFDPTFSENSYGFRKGRNAQQAVIAARDFQREGKRYVVDIDLSKFFDRVNHDLLIALIKHKIKDRRIWRLIDLYLKSGIMEGGITSFRLKGTPQGSPLSPLLSNIMLDKLDKELEKRGHSFCRYADDFSIYVKSQKAGERVYESISTFIEKRLKLKINKDKSKVDRSYRRNFLGYGFTSEKNTRLRVPKERLARLRKKVKQECKHGRGKNVKRFIAETLNPMLRGWANYYKPVETITFARVLDKWIRRRLRVIIWRQWERPWTRYKKIRKAGFTHVEALMVTYNNRSCWWSSSHDYVVLTLNNKLFASMGLVSVEAVIVP